MTEEKKKAGVSIRELCRVGLFAAVIAVTAHITIPMPMGVPITMQSFAIILAAVVLGPKLGALSVLIYLALGAVGLPILAGFTGGIDRFVGPTGGFLISFPLLAFVVGLGARRRSAGRWVYPAALVGGIVLNYAVGCAMFCLLMHVPVSAALTACVLPFIPGDAVKALLASAIGFAIEKRIPR